MKKFNEIIDEAERSAKLSYIDDVWTGWQEARQSSLSTISNYLFTLNAGALLAALTYVATKGNNGDIQRSIWALSFGILCSVSHAAIDYYSIEKYFSDYRSDVNKLYNNELEWEVFVKNNECRNKYDLLLHILGWASGILFVCALINGICHIS